MTAFFSGSFSWAGWPCAIAFLACAIIIEIMIHVGVLDHPVSRSSHIKPTPKGGGIGIMTAFMFCLPLQHLTHGRPLLDRPTACLLLSTFLLGSVSWLDDLRSFPARYKFAAQTLAAFILTASFSISWTWMAIFITGTIFLTNALNFMDGINGLAAGTMLLGALFLTGHGIAGTAFTLFEACLLAFLPNNFPKARIFMGDVGSQAGALVIAWGGIQCKGALLWLVPVLMHAIIWDVCFTLVRRTFAGDSLTQAHRGHLYQLAVRSGLHAALVAMIYWGFVILGGTLFSLTTLPLTMSVLILTQLGWTWLVCQRAGKYVPTRW